MYLENVLVTNPLLTYLKILQELEFDKNPSMLYIPNYYLINTSIQNNDEHLKTNITNSRNNISYELVNQ